MNYDNIPNELKQYNNWVCFKFVNRNGKKSKVPFNPISGQMAKSNDMSTWCTYDVAVNNAARYDGIGFQFSNSPFVGVDIDHCKDGDNISVPALDIIDTLKSYTEISPSGTGVHIICKGNAPDGGNRKDNIEIYSEGRYFTVTGKIFNSNYTAVNDCQNDLNNIHDKYIKKEKNKPIVKQETIKSIDDLLTLAIKSKQGNDFQSLFNGNWQLKYKSQSEADIAFCNMLAFWTKRDIAAMDNIFRRSGLMRDKWNKKHGAMTYGQSTLERAVNDCVTVYGDIAVKSALQLPQTRGQGIYHYTDYGNAKRFFNTFGESIRYDNINKVWHIWNGKAWAEDLKGNIFGYVRKMIDFMYADEKEQRTCLNTKMIKAAQVEDLKEVGKIKKQIELLAAYKKHINTTSNANKMQSVLTVAQSMKGIPILPYEMDKQKDLLNCQNGLIDLKTGKLLPHDRKLLITKISKAEYNSTAPYSPLWLQFLNSITCGDKDLEQYLQKAIGYSLTALTQEQCFFICQGGGSNGKSTFLEVIADIIGDYAGNIQIDSLMVKQNRNGTSDLARLKGIRFLTSSEPTQGMRLDEGLIKQLTGGDRITAAKKYGNEFEFTADFKLWIATNHEIIIRGTDKGIWRRIRVIPFNADIPADKIDKTLRYKLRKDLPSILKWAVDGCLLWQREGLISPQCVEVATQSYRQQMNTIERFINDCIEEFENYTLPANEVYQVYCAWCKINGEHQQNNTNFGKELSQRFNKKRMTRGMLYVDINYSEQGNDLLKTAMF